MKYSPIGSREMMPWSKAAELGGSVPPNPSPGTPRHYAVCGWVERDDGGLQPVCGVALSEMPAGARKPLLRDLDLPVTKALVYRGADGVATTVRDLCVEQVWDGWCVLDVALGDGRTVCVHSMHFADMNRGYSASFSSPATSQEPRRIFWGPLDKLPSDFCVIDVESTGTNSQEAEICELAAIKVVDGEVVAEFEQLVYIDGEMPRDAQGVHHISKTMLEDAPHMTPAMSSFLDFIGPDSVLVGHNISTYDIPLIDRVASQCGLAFSCAGYFDTLSMARKAWPGEKGHGMDQLRERFGLESHGAHRALKDCRDELAIARLEAAELAKPRQKAEAKPSRSAASPEKKASPKKAPRWASRRKAKEFTTEVTEFDETLPIFGAGVVVSGDLESMGYNDALQLVCDLGGQPQDSVTKKTRYLVVGNGAGAGKTAKAQELIEKGQEIEIIDEAGFLALVGKGGE